MKIKEKVLKKVLKVYGIKDNQFIEINHKKLGNTAVNVELPLTGAISLAFKEGQKSMDKKIFPKRKGYIIFNENQYFKHKKKIEKETTTKIIKAIDERLKLNILRRKIFNEVPRHPDGIGSDVLVAKEMLNYEDRFLKELKKELGI